LGGGGIRGAAHVGVLSVLEEADIRADAVAGTSVGSIVGAAYASGMSAAEMMDLLRPLSFKDVARPSVRRKFSLLDTTPLAEFVERSLGVKRFEDLDIPFAAVAADIVTGEAVVITEGELAQAVIASSAIPGVFPPIDDGEALYIDGGVRDLVPVGAVRGLGAEYVIAVDLIPVRERAEKPTNVMDLLLRSYEIMQHQVGSDAKSADAYMSPPVGGYRLLDFSVTEELYEHGRTTALERIDAIVDDLGV
jgi:NTE family protein